jgi:hypothetical protein
VSHLNNGITHILFGMRCPISNNGFAIGIGYLNNFTDCVLDITGFIFRLSTQGKAEDRLNKFAVSEMGSLFWFNNNTILKSVY